MKQEYQDEVKKAIDKLVEAKDILQSIYNNHEFGWDSDADVEIEDMQIDCIYNIESVQETLNDYLDTEDDG